MHTLSTSLERWCRCRLLLQLFLKASGWSSNSSGWIQPNLGPTKVTCCDTFDILRHPWTMLSIQDIQASSRCSTSLRYADKHFGPWHPWIHETNWFDSQISQVITFSSIEVPQVWKKKRAKQDPKLMYMRPHMLHAGHLLKWQGPLDTDWASVSNIPQASWIAATDIDPGPKLLNQRLKTTIGYRNWNHLEPTVDLIYLTTVPKNCCKLKTNRQITIHIYSLSLSVTVVDSEVLTKENIGVRCGQVAQLAVSAGD